MFEVAIQVGDGIGNTSEVHLIGWSAFEGEAENAIPSPMMGAVSVIFRATRLPDLAHVVLRFDHRLIGFTGECQRKLRHVHHHAVDPILWG